MVFLKLVKSYIVSDGLIVKIVEIYNLLELLNCIFCQIVKCQFKKMLIKLLNIK